MAIAAGTGDLRNIDGMVVRLDAATGGDSFGLPRQSVKCDWLEIRLAVNCHGKWQAGVQAASVFHRNSLKIQKYDNADLDSKSDDGYSVVNAFFEFACLIESGIVVDTNTPNSIIPNTFQKYRRSNGLRLFDISALTAARSPARPSYLLSRGSAFPQQWQSEDRRAGKEVRS